jgi:hypothetical protein
MRKQEEQRGIAAVMFAVLLLGIIGFAALALDIGMLYSQRTQLQRAADAGALAGAFTFVSEPFAAQPATATAHATAASTNNLVDNTALASGEVTVNVDTANRRVTVNIAHPENTFLARAFNINSLTIHVTAVAEAGPTANGGACVKPWFIPNTIVDKADDPCTACAAGKTLLQNNQVTPYALSLIQSSGTGNQLLIKPQQPANAIGPGQFYAIQLPGSGGASDYRDNIGYCNPVSIMCRNFYSVETGNMSGPTVQGAKTLINFPTQDTYLGLGQYQRPDGTISDTSQSLILAPIWDTCNISGFCPGGKFGTGTNVSVQVIGFGLVFVEGVQGGDVVVRLINVTPCGLIPVPSTAPYAIPVRLVRTD